MGHRHGGARPHQHQWWLVKASARRTVPFAFMYVPLSCLRRLMIGRHCAVPAVIKRLTPLPSWWKPYSLDDRQSLKSGGKKNLVCKQCYSVVLSEAPSTSTWRLQVTLKNMAVGMQLSSKCFLTFFCKLSVFFSKSIKNDFCTTPRLRVRNLSTVKLSRLGSSEPNSWAIPIKKTSFESESADSGIDFLIFSFWI